MKLRRHQDGRRPPPRWLLAVLAGLALALLSLGQASGRANASLSDYPTPLYLSGAASSVLGSSYKLLGSPGPGQPMTKPTAAAGAAGAPSGTYSYEYTVVDPSGGETAVSPASTVVTVASQSITVGSLPTGVTVDLYRKKAGLYTRVATLPNNGSATYSDNMDDATANAQPILPQTQNRPTTFGANSTGYFEFVPGVPLGPLTTTTSTAVAGPNFSGKGWIVDGSGGVSFPAGTWTFTTNLKGQSGTGTARLDIGMWKLDSSGAVVGSPLIDPAAAGENASANIATTAGTSSPIVTAINVGTFSLASGEHLYVQFWRHQTAVSTGTPITTLLAYDGVTKIVHPTVPNTPTLSAVAARVSTTPQLTATMSDPNVTDNGTLSFQLCSDSACNSVLQSGSAAGIANGAAGNWTPASLADGLYYWRAQATDSVANQSSWSGTSSFTVDSTPPGLPALSSPAAGARVNTSTLSATFVDSDPTDSGTVTFELCGADSTCSSSPTQSTSAIVGGGTSVNWTPATGGDGTYYWRARAQDVAGNQSAWTSVQSFVLDTHAPGTPTLVSPADGAYLGAGAGLSATFSTTDSGDSGRVDFQICSDLACGTVVASGSSSSGLADGANGGWVPASLADGSYHWRAQAEDAAGNQSAWSAVRTVLRDVTPPAVPTLASIPAQLRSTPQASATYADPPASDSGSLTFQLCADVTCATVLQSSTSAGVAAGGSASWTPSSLADGSYYLRVRAEDAAGNRSAWTGAFFGFDATPPPAPSLSGASGVHVKASPQLGMTVVEPNDPGDSPRMLVELCADRACASVIATGYTGAVPVDTAAGWQAPSLPDGTYYWRALAEDAAGNQSPWSAVGSFVVDTVPPPVPAQGGPAGGAIVNAPRLTGELALTAASGVEFQVCADAACAKVVAAGSAQTPASGAAPSWNPENLADGTYFWRIDAHDAAGNESAWSETKSFVLDRTPPSTPRALSATVTGTTLTLRWWPPARDAYLTGYALLVNGRRIRILTVKTHSVRITLRKVETRRFAVAAVDAAGNVSPPTKQVGPDQLRLG